jgi:hypothetical protein
MDTNISIVAKSFPAILAVLGFLLYVAGSPSVGFLLILLAFVAFMLEVIPKKTWNSL